MNRNLLIVILLVLAVASCQSKKPVEENEEESVEEIKPVVALTKIWSTDSVLTTNESIVYDAENQVYYVSCIGSQEPWASDGTGFISRINEDGSIAEAKWVTGLNAPKGLGLVGSTLYANDNDQLIAVDVNTGEIISSIAVGEAKSMNDIAVGVNDELYISDSNTNTVYKVEGGEVSTFYQDTLIGRLNGIYAESDRLLLAGFDSGKVWALDFETKTLVEKADGMLQADGIEKLGEGYFVSCWGGELHYLDADWARTKVLDTKVLEIRAADITVVPDKNLLLVPTFFDNRVMAYEVQF